MKTAAFALALIVSTIPAFAAGHSDAFYKKAFCHSMESAEVQSGCVKQMRECVEKLNISVQGCINDFTEDSGSDE